MWPLFLLVTAVGVCLDGGCVCVGLYTCSWVESSVDGGYRSTAAEKGRMATTPSMAIAVVVLVGNCSWLL